MIQIVNVKLTPWTGTFPSITLPTGSLERDGLGNLFIRWVDAPFNNRLLTADDIAGYVSRNVDIHRNRGAAIIAIADPGARLLTVEWREVDPWAGQPGPVQVMRGVASISAASSSTTEARLSIVIYQAQYLYQRASNLPVEGD